MSEHPTPPPHASLPPRVARALPEPPPEYLVEWMVQKALRESVERMRYWIAAGVGLAVAIVAFVGWLGVGRFDDLHTELTRLQARDSAAVGRLETAVAAANDLRETTRDRLRDALDQQADAARATRLTSDSLYRVARDRYDALSTGYSALTARVATTDDSTRRLAEAARVQADSVRDALVAMRDARVRAESAAANASRNDALLAELRHTALLSWTAVVTQGDDPVPFGGSGFWVHAPRIHRAASLDQRISFAVTDARGDTVCRAPNVSRDKVLQFRATGREPSDTATYVVEQVWATKQGGPWYRLGDSRLPDLAALRLRQAFGPADLQRTMPCGPTVPGGTASRVSAGRGGAP